MRQFFIFVGLGTLAAIVCEFVFKIFITHDYLGFIFTLVFYPLYVACIYGTQKLFLRWSKNRLVLFIFSYFLFGVIGLATEWFVIGNSPWQNPDASQLGMWAFWTAIVSLPTIYMTQQRLAYRIAVALVGVYLGLSIILRVFLPQMWAILIVWQIIFYSILQFVYTWHLKYLRLHPIRQNGGMGL